MQTTPGTAPPEMGDEAGEVLTNKQAQEALLSAQDLPSGWSVSASSDDGGTEDTKTKPARCAKLFDGLDDIQPAAKASADYTAGGFGPFVSHSVSSFEQDVAGQLDPVIDALDECPRFTWIEAGGSRTQVSTAPLSFPNYGDRSFAVRLTATSDDVDVVLDTVFVAKGNNGIAMIAGGVRPMKGKQLESLVSKAMKSLEQAAAGSG